MPDVLSVDEIGGRLRRRRSLSQSMQWDANLPDALVERIWNCPDALLADGTRLQDKPRCSVACIESADESFVWKRHTWGDAGRTLRKAFAQSVAKKCWIDGRFLSAAGVPTPKPRLYLERRVGPVKTASYLLTDYVPGTSLYRLMRFQRPTKPIVLHLARQAAAIWQQLDDLRIHHNDFKTENFLVDPQGQLWIIDLERLRRCRRTEQVRQRQIRDIETLLHPRNWRANPESGEVFRREIVQTPAAVAALAESERKEHPLSQPLPAINRPAQLLTVLIPCLNAEDTIVACLKSVRDMADEILVADAGSTDETLSIVRRFGGCRIVQQKSADVAGFESWATQQARHTWILRVLPNEQVNAELGKELQDLLATEPADEGFMISRSICFRGRQLNHGGVERDISLRLFRKDAVQFDIRAGQVEAVARSAPMRRLRFPLVYEACADMRLYLGEMMHTAADDTEVAHADGHRPRLRTVLWQAPWMLFKSYVLRGGWRDGWAGLHSSVLSAFAVYLREAMLWDLQQPSARSFDNDGGQEFKIFPADVGEDEPTVAYPFARAGDEIPRDDSDWRQMRPAA